MNKVSNSYRRSIFKNLLGGVLICIVSLGMLTSCENFLEGGDVKREIEEAIAYNNAKSLNVRIFPKEGSGSTIPSGVVSVKQGYDVEISFTESSAYSFIEWRAVDKDDENDIITDGVIFEDSKSPKTKVKIKANSDRIRLFPVCAERIAISGEPSPGYVSNGVSRDRQIFVEFTKQLSPENFIFSESEIPAGAEKKKDENGNVWSYTINGQTY